MSVPSYPFHSLLLKLPKKGREKYSKMKKEGGKKKKKEGNMVCVWRRKKKEGKKGKKEEGNAITIFSQ